MLLQKSRLMETLHNQNLNKHPRLSAFGSMAGFILLSSLAMGLLGLLILLPAYSELIDQRTNLYHTQQRIAQAEKIQAANERLIESIPTDPVLTKRLVKHTAPSELLSDYETPIAAPEKPWWYPAAEKLKKPALRRGLFLLASLTLGVAFFMFSPPMRKKA